MKIRDGFVSNSSSSSFVLVVDKKVADDLLNKIGVLGAECINFLRRKPQTFNGKDVYVYTHFYDAGGADPYEGFMPSAKVKKWMNDPEALAQDEDSRRPVLFFHDFCTKAQALGAIGVNVDW